MTTLSYESPQTPIELVQCKTGLTIFGILLILMGACLGCLATIAPVAAILMRNLPNASTAGQLPIQTVVMSTIVYGVLTAGFIWIGIGSIKARKWVGPVIVALTHIALYIGVFALIGMAMMVPLMGDLIRARSRAAGNSAPNFAAEIATMFSVVFALFVYLVLPGIFLWFYRRPIVRRTAEHFDATPRWTDALPQPIITIGFAAAIAAVSLALSILPGVVAAFGFVLTGVPGAILLASLSLSMLAGSVLAVKQAPAGWWVLVLLLLLFVASTLVNVICLDLEQYYQMMKLPEEQLDVIRSSGMNRPIVTAIFTTIGATGVLAYLLRAKRHFNFARSTSESLPA